MAMKRPTANMALVRIRQFHLPITAIGPENKAPMAAPAYVIVYINITFVDISSSVQLFLFPYAAPAAFQEPIM